MKASTKDPHVVRYAIEPRSIMLVLATVAGVWLVYRLWVAELVLIVALILAGSLDPLVAALEKRGLRRTHALIVLFVTLSLLAVALIFFTVPPLIQQLTQMVHDAPDTRLRLITELDSHPVTVPLANMVRGAGVEQTLDKLQKTALGYTTRAIEAVGYGITTLVLAFYLLADAKRVQGVVFALVPRDYHVRLARILQNLETIVGGYMRGQVITSAFLAAFTVVLLLLFSVPNALSLALFGALVDVIPFIGGLIVIVPAVLAALPQGPTVATIVFVAFCIYTEFESRILVPRIYGQVLRLSPPAVILALIAGGALLGVTGALIALPITAGLLMILEELRVELPGDDSVDRELKARDAKVEAVYEQLSAGATAPEAGQIAKSLASEISDADLADMVDLAKQTPAAD